MEAAIIAARIVQYVGAAALFGAPLFLVYAQLPAPCPAWARPLTAAAAGALLAGAAAYLLAQTASMAGDPKAALDPATLRGVLTESALGLAVLARAAAAAAALVLALAVRPGRSLWLAAGGLGAVGLLSFAWTGHGAADEGPAGRLHLAADLVHLLAAGIWIGALIAFALLLASPASIGPERARSLHRALSRFGGIGAAAVAAIVASGLVNSWLLVGPARAARLFDTPYGLVLLAKLVAFAGMAALAARNRFTHTPALDAALGSGSEAGPLAALRRSIWLETALGAGVLALVGVLGMLEPVASL